MNAAVNKATDDAKLMVALAKHAPADVPVAAANVVVNQAHKVYEAVQADDLTAAKQKAEEISQTRQASTKAVLKAVGGESKQANVAVVAKQNEKSTTPFKAAVKGVIQSVQQAPTKFKAANKLKKEKKQAKQQAKQAKAATVFGLGL